MTIESFATTPATKTWPAYLYQQYSDDPNLQSFVDSFNNTATQYLTWFNSTVLPDYSTLSGRMLDWIGTQLYGIARPFVTISAQAFANTNNAAPYAAAVLGLSQLGYGVSTASDRTYVTNTSAYMTTHYTQDAYTAASRSAPPLTYSPASDDVYRRVLQWNTYRGDGSRFTMRWLKNRVARFLDMDAIGSAPSIEIAAPSTIVIGAPASTLRSALESLFTSGDMVLPAQYSWEFAA